MWLPWPSLSCCWHHSPALAAGLHGDRMALCIGLQVLIISYETFRLHAERFAAEDACDLLICDEAHRLKSDQTLTSKVGFRLPLRPARYQIPPSIQCPEDSICQCLMRSWDLPSNYPVQLTAPSQALLLAWRRAMLD